MAPVTLLWQIFIGKPTLVHICCIHCVFLDGGRLPSLIFYSHFRPPTTSSVMGSISPTNDGIIRYDLSKILHFTNSRNWLKNSYSHQSWRVWGFWPLKLWRHCFFHTQLYAVCTETCVLIYCSLKSVHRYSLYACSKKALPVCIKCSWQNTERLYFTHMRRSPSNPTVTKCGAWVPFFYAT